MAKIGRNQPCPCGSGKKYKRCHGDLARETSEREFARLLARHQADELIREQQQGLGNPIIAAKVQDYQIVAVGNRLHYSRNWRTFPDFLSDYLKNVLDAVWGNAELAKPLSERHIILQWYSEYCRYQNENVKTPGGVNSVEITGVVACYMGLAYSLYLLDHNVELQQRMIKRLKNPGNFQGAYYELIVANVLIRAGFELTLEDETNLGSQHCEYAAVSKHTHKKYWVEGKMKAVTGLLGKTNLDGSPDPNPLSRLIPHLNGALAKPASDERLIFIDLNAEIPSDARQDNPHTSTEVSNASSSTKQMVRPRESPLTFSSLALLFTEHYTNQLDYLPCSMGWVCRS
jgi:hypothetical protein